MPMNLRLLRPRQAGGFDPRSIAGLRVWLDASDASTLTLNGSNVSEWRDKSGNNAHATQSVAANQPPYDATGFNGRGALLPSASTGPHFMNTANLPTKPQPIVFILALRQMSGNIVDTNSGSRLGLLPTGGTYIPFAPSIANSGLSVSGSPAPGDIVSIMYRGSTSFLRRNGTQSAALNPGTNSSTSLRLFTFSGATGAATGTFGELLGYGELSDSEILAVERYLAAKYGITLA